MNVFSLIWKLNTLAIVVVGVVAAHFKGTQVMVVVVLLAEL